MITWNDLKNLHVVKQTKHIIHKWWKIDTLIINEEDIFNKSLENVFFKNPLINDLLQKEPLKESFFNTLQLCYKQSKKNTTSFLEKWPGSNLNLYITPILTHHQFSGFVVGAGFFLVGAADEEVKLPLEQLGFSDSWHTKNKDNIPLLIRSDKNHFIDLVEMIAKEVSSVHSEFIEKNQSLSKNTPSHNISYGDMVGKSNIMHQLYNLLDKIKHSTNTILIQGENGTGKELIAKSIHQNSLRKDLPFIVQNCSALNDNLLESELFGHVKGSFTGAYKDKKGLFEMAHTGTFFLDEIGDTSPAMQVKLLRVLQEGTFFSVGGTELKKVDVRIIAATNKNLKQMVEEGRFREDLYYRLNVINIQVPPLRERTEDIALLADFFINRFSQQPKIFTKRALEKLVQYPWPGNVRELQNETERLAVFTGNDSYIKESFLSDKIREKENYPQSISFLNSNNQGKAMKKAIAQLERQMIAQSLKQEGWNKTKVAKKLGISRAALVSKVKDYKLEKRTIKYDNNLLRKT